MCRNAVPLRGMLLSVLFSFLSMLSCLSSKHMDSSCKYTVKIQLYFISICSAWMLLHFNKTATRIATSIPPSSTSVVRTSTIPFFLSKWSLLYLKQRAIFATKTFVGQERIQIHDLETRGLMLIQYVPYLTGQCT